MKSQPKIDETDVKILKALLRDARTSFVDIAKECNLSLTAITQRYKKLKKTGIITGTSLILGSDSVNRHHLSVDIKAEAGCETLIIEAIKKLPGVAQCYQVIGKYDIHAAIRIESLVQANRIKKLIRKEKGVLEIEITIGLDKACSFPDNLSIEPTEA